MKELEFTQENIKRYYEGEFSAHLQSYFTMGSHGGKNNILALTSYSNKNRQHNAYPANSCENNFIFSGLFLMMILVQQNLRRVIGDASDFLKCSGWPLISAGLAGPNFDAYRMLNEASLAPWNGEEQNYIKMLKSVTPFVCDEIKDFLVGENPANLNMTHYLRLKKMVNGKVDDIINGIKNDVDRIIKQIEEV